MKFAGNVPKTYPNMSEKLDKSCDQKTLGDVYSEYEFTYSNKVNRKGSDQLSVWKCYTSSLFRRLNQSDSKV